MLYNSGRYKLARRRKLNYREIKELAEEYYNDRFERANSFLRSARYSYKDQDYKIASFHLHQACENYYNSIILTFTLYSPKEHSLITLSGRAKTHSLESSEAFPRDTEEGNDFSTCCRTHTFKLVIIYTSASLKKISRRLYPK